MIQIKSNKTYGQRSMRPKLVAEGESMSLCRRLLMKADEIKSYELRFDAHDGRTYYIEIDQEHWERIKSSFDAPVADGNWYRRLE